MVLGGISIKVIKLMMAILALDLFLVAYGSAIDYGEGYAFYEGQSDYGPGSIAPTYGDAQTLGDISGSSATGSRYGHHDDNDWRHGDRKWQHDNYDWLSPGGSYYWWHPTSYNYDWYYTPTYYYSTPVYYTAPVVYYDWNIDPWWGDHIYGFGGTSYYTSSTHWSYTSGFGYW